MVNKHIKNVCKIGQGDSCCRYLIITPTGFECLKLSDMKDYIDSRVAMETMVAKSDNCEGKNKNYLNELK